MVAESGRSTKVADIALLGHQALAQRPLRQRAEHDGQYRGGDRIVQLAQEVEHDPER